MESACAARLAFQSLTGFHRGNTHDPLVSDVAPGIPFEGVCGYSDRESTVIAESEARENQFRHDRGAPLYRRRLRDAGLQRFDGKRDLHGWASPGNAFGQFWVSPDVDQSLVRVLGRKVVNLLPSHRGRTPSRRSRMRHDQSRGS